MSLINDALKRASQTQAQPPASTAAETPLRPVEHRRRFPAWLLLSVVSVMLVLACVAFYKGWQLQRTAYLNAGKLPVAARESQPADADPGGNRVSEKQESGSIPKGAGASLRAGPSLKTAGSNASNAEQATGESVLAPEPAKPAFPAVRLQGIFYRTANPSAILNTKTLRVGDRVPGLNVKVVGIGRESVTLEWNGETRVLTLE